jgi:hypothetical protein
LKLERFHRERFRHGLEHCRPPPERRALARRQQRSKPIARDHGVAERRPARLNVPFVHLMLRILPSSPRNIPHHIPLRAVEIPKNLSHFFLDNPRIPRNALRADRARRATEGDIQEGQRYDDLRPKHPLCSPRPR